MGDFVRMSQEKPIKRKRTVTSCSQCYTKKQKVSLPTHLIRLCAPLAPLKHEILIEETGSAITSIHVIIALVVDGLSYAVTLGSRMVPGPRTHHLISGQYLHHLLFLMATSRRQERQPQKDPDPHPQFRLPACLEQVSRPWSHKMLSKDLCCHSGASSAAPQYPILYHVLAILKEVI